MSNRVRCFAVILVIANVAGCRIEVSSGDDENPSSGESAFHRATPSRNGTISLAITTRDSNGEETATFTLGEQITLAYSVTNLSNRHQRLELPNAGYPWSCIRPEATPDCRWHSQNGRAYASVIVPVSLAPYEERIYTLEYGQQSNNGGVLGEGEYEVKVLFGYVNDSDLMGTAWHNFAIE